MSKQTLDNILANISEVDQSYAKQQIKDLFLEIYDNDYDEFEKKVKEL